MSCVWMLQRGHSGDGCVLASTLCKYDLRKGDLFVLSWARVRRVRRGNLSSELLVCGGGVRSILLLLMDVVFSVCIMRCGAVGARVWGVWVFRHAAVVCLCLVCILWQFSMLRSA